MPRDGQNLERELANLCDRIGGTDWKPLLKAIHDWIAEASGAERSRRIEALDSLIHEIKDHFARIDSLRQDWIANRFSRPVAVARCRGGAVDAGVDLAYASG